MLKRLLMLLVTMVTVSFLAFTAFTVIGGDPATILLGTQATPEAVAALREELGLNAPFLVQYWNWLTAFFVGDFGTSYIYNQSVTTLLAGKVGLSLRLCGLAFVIIVVLATPVALFSVRYEERPELRWRLLRGWDVTATQFSMSLPPFFLGVVITWVFSVVLKWFVVGSLPDIATDPVGHWTYLLFPAITLAVPRIAKTVRMLRATVVHQMRQDYVRTAIARGANRSRVLYCHVLKNALAPVVSFLAQTLAELVAAAIVVEQVFSLPGLGRMLISSIGNRDYAVVQAIVVMLALWVVAVNGMADLFNTALDPRLRMGGGK
ncbi:ABC transporter permease [Bengtsoniella intestinalis]|uniref:ABC transporter permease n=1 Tax=Bengtsoniella intestinalis TaxID=3073143 RepID=UPI00391EEBF2